MSEKDTEELLAEAEAEGYEDPNPDEVTDESDPSHVKPAKKAVRPGEAR